MKKQCECEKDLSAIRCDFIEETLRVLNSCYIHCDCEDGAKGCKVFLDMHAFLCDVHGNFNIKNYREAFKALQKIKDIE